MVSHCGGQGGGQKYYPDVPTSKSATHDALETRARPDESRTTPLWIFVGPTRDSLVTIKSPRGSAMRALDRNFANDSPPDPIDIFHWQQSIGTVAEVVRGNGGFRFGGERATD